MTFATTSEMINRAVRERTLAGFDGSISGRSIASGAGWRILDVLCTCGEEDRISDEEHTHFSLAMVLGGAFEYRGRSGPAQLAPGSILIGRAGDPFRCWHTYGRGDRCVAVQFEAGAFDELSSTFGSGAAQLLPTTVPVLRSTAGLFAFAELYATGRTGPLDDWETAVRLADRILSTAYQSNPRSGGSTPDQSRRMLELARWLETDPSAEHNVEALAEHAGLSKFHFIRSFSNVTGLSPYAFVTRARLREASKEIAGSRKRIIDIAMESGFSDLSTFNHLFKRHYGHAPLALRHDFAEGHAQALFQA